MSDWLVDLPAAPVNVGGRPRKGKGSGSRMRKLACDACGLILYSTSARAVAECGLPTCACGGAFVVPTLRDRAAIEWDTLAQELAASGPHAWNAAMRELGAHDLLLAVNSDGRLVTRERRGGLAPARCQWEGGYCAKYVTGRYCPEHDPYGRDA